MEQALDMKLFGEGDYLRAIQDQAMAETISKILYPEDRHVEGKSLRLKQQYFFVSASIQGIINRHMRTYGRLDNLPKRVVIQINDTHPTMVIPELIRLLGEQGIDFDEATDIACVQFKKMQAEQYLINDFNAYPEIVQMAFYKDEPKKWKQEHQDKLHWNMLMYTFGIYDFFAKYAKYYQNKKQ